MQLFVLMLLPLAQADIPPPPKCPSGTHLVGRRECIKDGYVRIYLFDVIPRKSELNPRVITTQLQSGELTIPELDTTNVIIGQEVVDIPQENAERTEQVLKDFFQAQYLRAESQKEARLAEEKKNAALLAEKEERLCAKLPASQSLLLALWGLIFSILRRRNLRSVNP